LQGKFFLPKQYKIIMSILYSSVVKLTALNNLQLSHDAGQHAHAAFYHLIDLADPVLAAQLHQQKGRKPFTVSPLMGLPVTPPNQPFRLRAGWEGWLRFTILDSTLFQTFISAFVTSGLTHRGIPSLQLGEGKFAVQEVLTSPESHPMAGYLPMSDLLATLEQPAHSRFRFDFFTPTSFGWKGDAIQTLPTPRLVFGNLATAWQVLSGENSTRAVEEYASEWLVSGKHKLQTERIFLHGKNQIGTVGFIEQLYFEQQADSLELRFINLLAQLAFFTGVGRKTTHGMGMATCRVW
jgi:CRISPR-associated endoribonuclease Cas6